MAVPKRKTIAEQLSYKAGKYNDALDKKQKIEMAPKFENDIEKWTEEPMYWYDALQSYKGATLDTVASEAGSKDLAKRYDAKAKIQQMQELPDTTKYGIDSQNAYIATHQIKDRANQFAEQVIDNTQKAEKRKAEKPIVEQPIVEKPKAEKAEKGEKADV